MEKLSFRKGTVQEKSMAAVRHGGLEPVELILGKEVYDLEKRLAAWVGAEHCVAVSDAASAVALALRAAGIGEGATVMCAALGCALPVQGIMLAGALPVFADVNPNTYTIDPFCLEYALGKLGRSKLQTPRAIIATSLFGAPCHFTELEQICRAHDIILIEDMSQAFGAKYLGRMAGNFGRFSVASFASGGPLEEPGGGAVFCRSQSDAAKVSSLRRALSQQSMEPGPGSRAPRMASADASLTGTRLDGLGQEHDRRRKAAERYRQNLAGKVRIQRTVEGGQSVYSQLVVALPREVNRAAVVQRLFGANIPSGPPLCGAQSADTDWNRTMLVNTKSLADRLLSLPIHPHLSGPVVDFICHSLLEAMGGVGVEE